MADCGKEYPQTAGRNEKYIGFPIPLTTMRMLLLASKLGQVQIFLGIFLPRLEARNITMYTV